MTYRLAIGLILGCFWLMTAIPNVWGADIAHFQAVQLTKLSESVALPDTQLPNVDGESVALRSFRDRVVLVNFWTTW